MKPTTDSLREGECADCEGLIVWIEHAGEWQHVSTMTYGHPARLKKPDSLREIAEHQWPYPYPDAIITFNVDEEVRATLEHTIRLRDEAWLTEVRHITPLWTDEQAALKARVNARMVELLKAETRK